MKYIIALMPLLALFLITSCRRNIDGSGHYITVNRGLALFHEIESDGDFTVHITTSNERLVQIHAEDNIMPHIVTCVDGGRLRIYFDNEFRDYDHHGVTINIAVPYADNISLMGSGDIYCNGTIATGHITTILSGSGNIHVNMDVNSTKTVLSGSGDVYLNGVAKDAEHFISGSGRIHGFGLQTLNTIATISGSGRCEVNAEDHLTGNISGSGDVIYTGSPRVETHISGSGTVRPL